MLAGRTSTPEVGDTVVLARFAVLSCGTVQIMEPTPKGYHYWDPFVTVSVRSSHGHDRRMGRVQRPDLSRLAGESAKEVDELVTLCQELKQKPGQRLGVKFAENDK